MDNRVVAAESALDILAVLPYSLDANCILAELWLTEQRPSDAQPYVSRVEELDPYLAFRLTTEKEPPESLIMIEALDTGDRLQQEPETPQPEEIVPSSVADDIVLDELMSDEQPTTSLHAVDEPQGLLSDDPLLDDELDEFADPLFGDEAEFVKGDAPLSLGENDDDIDPSDLFGEITGASVEDSPSVDAMPSEPLDDAEIDPSDLFGEITGASVEDLPSLDAVPSEPLDDADIDPSELFGEITGASVEDLPSIDDLPMDDDDLSDMSWLDEMDDIHLDTGDLPEADTPKPSSDESDEAWFQELQDLEASSLTPTGLTESDDYADDALIDSSDWYVTEQDDDNHIEHATPDDHDGLLDEEQINPDEAFGLHVDATIKPAQDLDVVDDFDDIVLDFPIDDQQGVVADDGVDDESDYEQQDDSNLHKLLRPLDDDMSMDDDLFSFDDEELEEFEFDTSGLPIVGALNTDADDNDWLTDFDGLDNTDSFEWLSDSDPVTDDDTALDDLAIAEQSNGIVFDDEPLLDDGIPSMMDDDDVDFAVAAAQMASMVEDEELDHTPADSAPDWLNAMVPGLDNNFDTQDIDPLDEVLEDVQQEEQASAGFAWLNDIVEIETGAMPPVTPKPAPPPAVPLRFAFSDRPVWLDKLLGLDTDNVSQAATRRANIDGNLPDWLDIDNSN
jgi:hypothetical protein